MDQESTKVKQVIKAKVKNLDRLVEEWKNLPCMEELSHHEDHKDEEDESDSSENSSNGDDNADDDGEWSKNSSKLIDNCCL